jgi:iron-sulfur cluster assembly protein
MIEETTDEFPVDVTARAIVQIRKVLARDPKPGQFLRIGVKGGGCSGLEYVMKADTVRHGHDMLRQFEDVEIVCDAKSAVYLRGATLDYTGSLLGGGFQFQNPNAGRTCGCGTSFTPKRVAG